MTVTAPAEPTTVTRLNGQIGAVVDGINLGANLPIESIAAVRSALLTHKVLFFRNQNLDDDAQADFAERFGTLTTAHPTVNTGSSRVLRVTANRGMAANAWHTDVSFVDRVPAISVLRAVTLPPYGGNTVWANTAAAYAGLPRPLRSLVDHLWAVHTNSYDYAQRDEEHDEPDANYTRADFASTPLETRHPAVQVHPETGERSLLLGNFVRSFEGFNHTESVQLFNLLQQRISRLENTIRWQWRAGDVAMWDNRSTQHYAVADFDDHPREMRRITVAGEVPVSIDGERSQMLRGDSSVYARLDSLIS